MRVAENGPAQLPDDRRAARGQDDGAHFAGAACGKGLSGKPGSTIGFERRFNPALQRASKSDFVEFVLEGLPPQSGAFAANRRLNLGLE